MSLYQLEKDGDVEELLTHLRESHSPAVRERAATLIGQLQAERDGSDEHVRDELVETVCEDGEGTVRAAAIDALDEIGQDAVERLMGELSDEVETDDEPVPVAAFVDALTAERPELRMVAANALGQRGDMEAVPRLCERLTDPDPRVRDRAARACGELKDPRAVDALAARLDDDAAGVKREAAEALGAIGTGEALTALLDLLEEPDEALRRIAVAGLGNVEDAPPVEHLARALEDESNLVRRTAVFSLLSVLANASTQGNHEIREAIVETLSETDDPTVIDWLVNVLEDGAQPAQQRNAAWLLGRVTGDEGREVAIDALISALDHDDRMTVQCAATSLVAIGGGDVEAALLDLLDSATPANRRAEAVFVLGKIGGERSRERLDALLETAEDDLLRKRVFSAISKLGGRA